jgi:hypothetical protein
MASSVQDLAVNQRRRQHAKSSIDYHDKSRTRQDAVLLNRSRAHRSRIVARDADRRFIQPGFLSRRFSVHPSVIRRSIV